MLRLAQPALTLARKRLPPIKERIREALALGPKSYQAVMREVFPEELFPRAYRRATQGGPPGCAVVFGRALRELGISSTKHASVGHCALYFPPSEAMKRKTGYNAKKARWRARVRKALAAEGAAIEKKTGINPNKGARFLVANLLRRRRASK